MKTRAFGNVCESVVSKWLEQKGYKILARNYTVRGGELDIVAVDADTMAFIEVKSRHAGYDKEKYGRPSRAVDYFKRQRLALAAQTFLKQYPSKKRKRFDVIEVIADEQPTYTSFEIKHIKSAFSAR